MNIFEKIERDINGKKERETTLSIEVPSVKQLNDLLSGKSEGDASISFSLSMPSSNERLAALESAFAELAISLTGGDM